ncbi:hypothetical protein [Bacteriovorax sp. Seq25_V]|uniref:hypothetical protein n=1 Tax=Bacteriovorax sp. Seq25_V TaxID=1201288 RepID=UPI00038A3DEB|nr:hypothetical protein [Bacteriovorax sp. Seq25_V]EQC43335.1 hypothetical protein M900_0253 [Bacteriovorax sp. Seq25_V]
MKKLLLVLLLTTNVFAISESNTDQGTDTQCLHKGYYKEMAEIDQMLANSNKEESKAVEPTTLRR